MTELKQYLQYYTGASSDEVLEILSSYFQPMILEKGDYFLKAGRVCDKFSFQCSGLLRIYAHYEEKEITQWISSKNSFITDLSGLICNEPGKFHMQALTPCTFYTMYKTDYNNLPSVIESWPHLERTLLARCFKFMESRVFGLLAMSGEERYKFIFGNNPSLFNEVPLKYLASMIGMTPESMSRIRKSLTEQE